MGDHFRDDVQLTMNIFDTVISPILTYGSEVWGVDHDGKLENDPIEFVQTKFIRWLLGVNKFCSSNACRSEVGRFPMRTKTKCRAIKYWLKFCEPEHQNKLSGIAFTDQIGQDKKELWSSKLRRLLKARRSWRHMVSENEHSRNHVLYTTETLGHRTANMDQRNTQ